MATELQHRGTDATGFCIMDEDGALHVWKMASPAWKAICTPEFNNWCDKALTPKAQILLVHTRAYTKGSPHNNENNHPLYGRPLLGVVVHNGMVRNDDALFESNRKIKGFERSCATDSDIFRALLDNHGSIDKALIKDMGLVEGTAAVAAVHKASPGRLLLLRDSNPLVLGATADTLAFASTKEALHKVLKPWVEMHNIPMQVHAPDLSFVAMPNETGYIIGPKGLEDHEVFKCNGRGVGGYVKYAKTTSYWDRQEKARTAALTETRYKALPAINPTTNGRASKEIIMHPNKPKPDELNNPSLFEFTICPNEKCNKHVELSVDDRRLTSIALLSCNACGSNLAGGPDASMQVN